MESNEVELRLHDSKLKLVEWVRVREGGWWGRGEFARGSTYMVLAQDGGGEKIG